MNRSNKRLANVKALDTIVEEPSYLYSNTYKYALEQSNVRSKWNDELKLPSDRKDSPIKTSTKYMSAQKSVSQDLQLLYINESEDNTQLSVPDKNKWHDTVYGSDNTGVANNSVSEDKDVISKKPSQNKTMFAESRLQEQDNRMAFCVNNTNAKSVVKSVPNIKYSVSDRSKEASSMHILYNQKSEDNISISDANKAEATKLHQVKVAKTFFDQEKNILRASSALSKNATENASFLRRNEVNSKATQTEEKTKSDQMQHLKSLIIPNSNKGEMAAPMARTDGEHLNHSDNAAMETDNVSEQGAIMRHLNAHISNEELHNKHIYESNTTDVRKITIYRDSDKQTVSDKTIPTLTQFTRNKDQREYIVRGIKTACASEKQRLCLLPQRREPVITRSSSCSFQERRKEHGRKQQETTEDKKLLTFPEVVEAVMQKPKIQPSDFYKNARKSIAWRKRLEQPWMKGSEMHAFYKLWKITSHTIPQKKVPKLVHRSESLPKNFKFPGELCLHEGKQRKTHEEMGIFRDCCCAPKIRLKTFHEY